MIGIRFMSQYCTPFSDDMTHLSLSYKGSSLFRDNLSCQAVLRRSIPSVHINNP